MNLFSWPKRSRGCSQRLAWLTLILLLVCTLMPLRRQFRLVLVVGESMRPTLHTGDLLVVNTRAYETTEPRRNDVVVVHCGHQLLVKRIVGLPGEEVEVRDGTLFVNDAPMAEGHAITPGPLDIARGRLFPGKFAVLGDSRSVWPRRGIHAIVTKEDMAGEVVCRVSIPGLRSPGGQDAAARAKSASSPAAFVDKDGITARTR